MVSSSTVATGSQIPTDFCFPLRPEGPSSSPTRKNATNNHSRQYTGIQLPFPIKSSDISPPPPFQGFPELTTESSTKALKANAPHRKHAHRRSAAISHDFQIPDKGLALVNKPSSPSSSPKSLAPSISLEMPPSKQNFSLQSSRASLSSSSCGSTSNNPQPPTAVLASSSCSSLPLQESSLLSSNECLDTGDQHPKPHFRKPRVQFASEVTEIDKIPDYLAPVPVTPTSFEHLQLPDNDNEQLLQLPQRQPMTPPQTPPKKHRRVKSWAGSFIKFRSSKKDTKTEKRKSAVEIDSTRKSEESVFSLPVPQRFEQPSPASSGSPLPEFHSSSYVSTADISDSALLSLAITSEPAIPLIDLDAALGPFRTPKLSNSFRVPQFEISHRRTESAPEAVLEQGPNGGRPRFDRVMKRKVNSSAIESDDVIIEEEEDSTPLMGQQQAASLSTTSLVSNTSVTSNRDRARLARNFNSLTLGPFAPVSNSAIPEKPLSDDSSSNPSPQMLDETALAHIKALHRLSSTTNDTITPSMLQRPNSSSSELDSPATIRESTDSVSSPALLPSPSIGPTEAAESISSVPESQSEIFDFGEPGPEVRTSVDSGVSSTLEQTKPQLVMAELHHHQQQQQQQQQQEVPRRGSGHLFPPPQARPRPAVHARNHPNRFSISSLTSFSLHSTNSEARKNSVSKRVWGWMRGKRTSD